MWWGWFHVEFGFQAKGPSSPAFTCHSLDIVYFQRIEQLERQELRHRSLKVAITFLYCPTDDNMDLSTIYVQTHKTVAAQRAERTYIWSVIKADFIRRDCCVPSCHNCIFPCLWKCLASVPFFSVLSGGIWFMHLLLTQLQGTANKAQSKDIFSLGCKLLWVTVRQHFCSLPVHSSKLGSTTDSRKHENF